MRKVSSNPKRRRISMLVVILILCNLFQTVLLALNFYVLGYQRDMTRYLFEQAFTKTQ